MLLERENEDATDRSLCVLVTSLGVLAPLFFLRRAWCVLART